LRIISTTEARILIIKALGNDRMTPQFPLIPEADEVILPSLAFMNTWQKRWANENVVNTANVMCNHVAKSCVCYLNNSAAINVLKSGRDRIAALFECRVKINSGELLGCQAGTHVTTLLMLDNTDDVFFYEPQNPKFEIRNVRNATNVDIFDVIM
jgi:hypothetical protein